MDDAQAYTLRMKKLFRIIDFITSTQYTADY